MAVSGGPDSIALLILAAAAFPGQVEAATIDHRLREASAREADFVAALCGTLGIAHMIKVLAELPKGNRSALARVQRYAALEGWRDERRLDWLLTAHHADDQLETMIMRLNRASGVGGLSAVRRRQGTIVRPLLHWTSTELAALVAAAGIIPVDDPTNRDNRYDRARLRKLLAGADWLDPRAAARSADALADADAALEWAVGQAARRTIVVGSGTVVFDAAHLALPAEIARRIVLRCLARVDPQASPRGAVVDALITALTAGRSATVGSVLCRGGTKWTFAPAPPRRARPPTTD